MKVESKMDKNKCVQYLNAGVAKKRNGDYEGALLLYKEAEQYDSTNYNIYYNSAKIYLGLGKYPDSLSSFIQYSKVLKEYNKFSNPMEDAILDQIKRNIVKYSPVIKKHIPIDLDKFISNPGNKKIVVDINCSKYVGVCLISNYPNLKKEILLSDSDIGEIKNSLLGKPSNSELDEKKEYALIILGLKYLAEQVS